MLIRATDGGSAPSAFAASGPTSAALSRLVGSRPQGSSGSRATTNCSKASDAASAVDGARATCGVSGALVGDGCLRQRHPEFRSRGRTFLSDGRVGGAGEDGTDERRCVWHRQCLDVVGGEACVVDGRQCRAVAVAADEEAVEPVHPVLVAGAAWVVVSDVLDEQERSSGAQDAADL